MGTQPPVIGPNPIYNEADLFLMAEADLARRAIRGTSAGSALLDLPPLPGSSSPSPIAVSPLVEMPATGRPLHYTASLATPAPGSNDTEILSFIAPAGYIAIVKRIAQRYMPAGWVQGSTDLIFRVSVDGAFAPGFDNMTTQLGSESDPYHISGAIIVKANQTYKHTISVDAGFAGPTGAGNNVIVVADGWLVPEGLLQL